MCGASKNITIDFVVHKGEKRIKLVFGYDVEIIKKIKSIPGRAWSQSMNCWHVPDDKNIFNLLKEIGLVPLDKKYENIFLRDIPEDFKVYILQFKDYINYKRYSKNTLKVYLSMIKIFFKHNNYRPPKEITRDDIILFNTDYILKNNFSFNYQNQMISAIKLFFEKFEHRKLNIEDIERPKRPKNLPGVLSKKEVSKLINAITNLKHKAILSLIYSAGLRVGEAINMKITDIDSERGLIYIRKAKGNKDRVANLSPSLLKLLREYYKSYKPKEYLFNGQFNIKYTQSSVRKILIAAKNKAGIKKDIKVHTLRHSFATHMLEKGIDIRYIQEMLGHQDPKTTMIYTHVSEKKINSFTNPLDEIL